MTCIAGVARDGEVWVGADSAGVSGWTLESRPHSKLFRVSGGMLIGASTSYRMIDLLRYRLPEQPFEHADPHRYLATEFIDQVRALFGEGGFRKKENEREEGGSFLVGWLGRLWDVGSDFNVGECQRYGATGSGVEAALGALFLADVKCDPESAVTWALRAAEAHNIGVRGPFEVLRA